MNTKLLISIYTYVLFIILMLLAFVSAYPLFILSHLWSKKPRVYFQKIVQQYFKIFYFLMPNLGKIIVHNKHNVNRFSPCIYVSSHQSSIDYTLLATMIDDYVIPSNHFISDHPAFFTVPRHALGVYYIPTGNLAKASKGYKDFIKALTQGSSVIIFPEGTRNASTNLRRFKGGAFRLAITQNVPLVPVIIKGTGNIVSKGSNITKTLTKENIHVTFLNPIYPEQNEIFTALSERVKKVMQTHINTHTYKEIP